MTSTRSSEKWRSQINNFPDLILSRSATSISLSFGNNSNQLSFQLFSNSVLGAGTLRKALPFYLDRLETVRPKIEQLSPGISRNMKGKRRCLHLVSPRTSRAPYLKFCARRKLGSSEIIATKTINNSRLCFSRLLFFLCIFVQGRRQPTQSQLIQIYSVDWIDVYDRQYWTQNRTS